MFLCNLVLVLAQLASVSQAVATCYLMTGDVNPDKNVAPCKANATGTTGSHSACCNAGNSDICLSSGLCLNTLSYVQSHVLWASGCTDPTLQDPSCPQVCQGSKYGNLGNYGLRSCDSNEANNTWCCGVDGQNTTECCKNSFKLPVPVGQLVRQLSPSATAGEVSSTPPASSTTAPPTTPATQSPTTSAVAACPDRSGLVAGVAVTSVIAGLATIALAVASVYIHKLRQKDLGPAAAAVDASSYDPYQQQQQFNSSYTPFSGASTAYGYPAGNSTSPEMAGLPATELHAVDSRPNAVELPEKGAFGGGQTM